MKNLALLVFVIGVAIAACYASRAVTVEHGSGPEGAVTAGDRVSTWASAAGLPFAVGLALMIAGGVMGRRVAKAEAAPEAARDEAAEGAYRSRKGVKVGPETIFRDIDRMISALPHENLGKHQKEIHETLDEVLEELVPELIAHKEHLVAEMGLGRYAEMIGHFASMERNAARAWSALTDGAYEEAEESLSRAKESLGRSREAFFAAHAPS